MYPTLIAGWDSAGPLATLHTRLFIETGADSRRFQGTTLVHLSSDGTHLDSIGGAGCRPVDLTLAGKVLCLQPSSLLQVRSAAGQDLWSVPGDCWRPPLLSPNGDRIACANVVYAQIGSSAVKIATFPPLPPGSAADPEVWLDNSTLVYYDPDPAAAGLVWAQLPDLSNLHRLTGSRSYAVGMFAAI
jgi:hypothetical protein